MIYFKSLLFWVLAALIHCQAQLPSSYCLGNCMNCAPSNPFVCLGSVNNSTGSMNRCMPYYDGPECTTGGSFYNLYTENGVLNNFASWSGPAMPQRQQCQSLKGGPTMTALGPFRNTLAAAKNLQFTQAQGVNRLIIKMSVGVSDSRLTSSSNDSQEVETVTINGTTFITTTTTNQNQTQRIQTIPFVVMSLSNPQANNAVFSSVSTGYREKSTVQTKCGFVYQYQFEVQAPSGTLFEQVQLTLTLPTDSPTLWWLFDFRVQAGCSGFSVGTLCDTCLTGFYPALTDQDYPDGCKPCDYACTTCGQRGTCLSCQQYATYNSNTRTCSYPSSYSVYRDNFTVTSGTKLNNVSSLFFKNLYRSTSRQLALGYSLQNNQSYLMRMYLIYPRSYATAGANFTITINNQTWVTPNANTDRATLSNLNNGSAQLFATPFSIDRMNGGLIPSRADMLIRSNGVVTQQFYLADLTIVQYQCGQNCIECVFSLSQTSTCRTCGPFYRQDLNCLICSNGFYEVKGAPNRCVKCSSNCKQCRGPSRYDCIECFEQFGLADTNYNNQCIQKIIYQYKDGNSDFNCTLPPTRQAVASIPDCTTCLSQSEINQRSRSCIVCWAAFGYVWGRCGPLPTSGYSFFATQAMAGQGRTGWTAPNIVSNYQCSSDYKDLVGVPNSANSINRTTAVPTSLSTTVSNMPSHSGLRFYLNIIKVDHWVVSPSNQNKTNPLTLTVTVTAPTTASTTYQLSLDNSYGANVCGQAPKQMIWALSPTIAQHSVSTATITINSPDRGVFIRQLEVYLANCPQCNEIGLSYSLFFLPVYTDNSTQTGLDVIVDFNNPVLFVNNSQAANADIFAQSFSFTIDEEPVQSSTKQIYYTDPDYRYGKYFIPLSKSYVNSTVTASTSQPDLVYTQEGTSTRKLITSTQSGKLQRYIDASPGTRRSIGQLSDFFHFFTWFCLITMIVAIMLGVGVVFEEFSQIMQIIFYHIYITSWLLPPTIKVPLSHAVRMEHLNYFSNIQSIENSLFGMDPLIPSNPIFLQYNIDVYFLRSIYPILIINAIFIGWFIILKILQRAVSAFRNSPNKLFRFARSIPGRPLAYFDQIWRYQYLAVMWACMLQFTSFQGEGSMILNLIICILAFTIAVLWPFVVTIYTFRKHFTTNVKHFLYLYHDIYYLKTSSLADKPKYYLYVGIRTVRLFSYAIFIALLVNQSIIGPVLLIFINLVDAAVSFFLKIYRTGAYLLTRIIENILLIIAAILCMIIYGFSDRDTLDPTGYEDLGYGLTTVFVLIIINATVRFLYLTFKKIQQWSLGTYDVGERGELQNYDNFSPVKKDPQSDRIDNNY